MCDGKQVKINLRIASLVTGRLDMRSASPDWTSIQRNIRPESLG